MTRKDFLLIEHGLYTALRAAPSLREREGVEIAIRCFADLLGTTNWRFNREKFIECCYNGVPDAEHLFPTDPFVSRANVVNR